MEANAIYFGATPVIALYQGAQLIWSGFELPIQEGTNVKITQTYNADLVGSKLEVE